VEFNLTVRAEYVMILYRKELLNMTVEINSGLVRSILGKKQMSIPDLAEQVGVSPQTIYNLLSGGGFRQDTLGKLAEVLETTPSRLIDPREAEVA